MQHSNSDFVCRGTAWTLRASKHRQRNRHSEKTSRPSTTTYTTHRERWGRRQTALFRVRSTRCTESPSDQSLGRHRRSSCRRCRWPVLVRRSWYAFSAAFSLLSSRSGKQTTNAFMHASYRIHKQCYIRIYFWCRFSSTFQVLNSQSGIGVGYPARNSMIVELSNFSTMLYYKGVACHLFQLLLTMTAQYSKQSFWIIWKGFDDV